MRDVRKRKASGAPVSRIRCSILPVTARLNPAAECDTIQVRGAQLNDKE
mgnify:CR=1 FL=1